MQTNISWLDVSDTRGSAALLAASLAALLGTRWAGKGVGAGAALPTCITVGAAARGLGVRNKGGADASGAPENHEPQHYPESEA